MGQTRRLLVFSSVIDCKGRKTAAQSGVRPRAASPGSTGKSVHDLQLPTHYLLFFFKSNESLVSVDCVENILLGGPINTETHDFKKSDLRGIFKALSEVRWRSCASTVTFSIEVKIFQ